eukprot:8849440-Alexandrium_andersonii.AAC.1
MCIRDSHPHGDPLGPPRSRLQTGAAVWAEALRQSDLGRCFAAPQVAVDTHLRTEYSASWEVGHGLNEPPSSGPTLATGRVRHSGDLHCLSQDARDSCP